jgi:hypothetical protein
VAIKIEKYIPPKKASRSEIVTALRQLSAGQSILITNESLTDKTRDQVYKAASRERLEIRTQKTSIGLRVWLKDSERASIERENSVEAVEIAESEEKDDFRDKGMYFPNLRRKRRSSPT